MIREHARLVDQPIGISDIVALFSIKSLSKPFFAIAIACFASQSFAASFSADARYVVTLRGANIAEVGVSFSDNGKSYNVDINGDVAGLASLVAAGTAKLSSSGTSTGTQLQSKKFSIETRSNGDRFNVSFQANGGNVSSFQIFPPLSENKNRVPVAAKHRNGINDPVAAFLIKADSLAPEICNRTLSVFTGIERYDIDLSFAENQTATSKRTGYQGPVVLCRMKYRPISGHFTNSDTTNYMKSNQRFLVWYAPLGDTGYAIPYRVLIGTAFGDLSMVLTRLNP